MKWTKSGINVTVAGGLSEEGAYILKNLVGLGDDENITVTSDGRVNPGGQKISKLLSKMDDERKLVFTTLMDCPNFEAAMSKFGEKLPTTRTATLVLSDDIEDFQSCSMNTVGWDSCFKFGGQYHASVYTLWKQGAYVAKLLTADGKLDTRVFIFPLYSNKTREVCGFSVGRVYGNNYNVIKDIIRQMVMDYIVKRPMVQWSTKILGHLPYMYCTGSVGGLVYFDNVSETWLTNDTLGQHEVYKVLQVPVYDATNGTWHSVAEHACGTRKRLCRRCSCSECTCGNTDYTPVYTTDLYTELGFKGEITNDKDKGTTGEQSE